jgi:hypothetical protein
MSKAFATAAALVLIAAFAAAPRVLAASDDDTGRYSMSPADGGFVRLDRKSGAMTFCTKTESAWNCSPMGDAQQSTNAEIERLQAENKDLKTGKRNLEDMLGMADPDKPRAPETGSTAPPMKVPSEQDVDQAFDYIEGMVKKFRERMKKLEQGAEGGTSKGQQL